MSAPHIFFTVYDGDIEKNFLRSGILARVVAAGFRVVLLVRARTGSEKERYYRKNFETTDVIVETIEGGNSTAERYWYHFSWNTIPTHTSYVKRHDLYLKHKNVLRYALENFVWALGHVRVWREFVRFVYYVVPDSFGEKLFDKYKPVLFFATNMFSAADCRLLRTAKKRGIPTLTIMKSWDVPTTRGFTRVKADRILTFNDINKRETIAIGDYAPEKVHPVGFPQFDLYSHKDIYVPRETFYKTIGADLSKKLLLFAAPGDWKGPFTHEVLQMLDDAISKEKFREPVQILARFHPKYPSSAEQIASYKHVIKDRPGHYFEKKMEAGIDAPSEKILPWTFDDNDLRHLANSLKHSAVTMNTESTMTLDAVSVGRPVVLIGFDGKQKLDYWHSIRRNYDREHLQNVLKTGGAPLATNFDELVSHINRYLENENADSEGRTRIVKELLFGNDGRAAERIANHVIEMAKLSAVK